MAGASPQAACPANAGALLAPETWAASLGAQLRPAEAPLPPAVESGQDSEPEVCHLQTVQGKLVEAVPGLPSKHPRLEAVPCAGELKHRRRSLEVRLLMRQPAKWHPSLQAVSGWLRVVAASLQGEL